MTTTLLGDLLEYEILLDYEPEEFKLANVTFRKDFGSWKKGQRLDILWIDFEVGKMVEIKVQTGFLVVNSKTEVEVATCRFRIEAVT